MSLIKGLNKEDQRLMKKKDFPKWIDPMLATLTDERFSDDAWVYERKLDGERAVVYKKGKSVSLMSRNKKRINNSYPELVKAIGVLEGNFIADGEIVAFDGDKTSFAKLQPRMHRREPDTSIPVFYYLFDLLYFDGHDIQDLPLRSRKKILRQFDFKDPIRFLNHVNEKGKQYYKSACSKGWEGVIAKDATYRYVNSRSKKWLKFKCVNEQEFVIGGYTEPQGSRIGFGALLIGYFEGDKLRYAGKVGTGYNDQLLKDLGDKLKKIEDDKKPFVENIKEKKVHWVNPKFVCEVKFTEWTDDGKLRHPAFMGLRRDKDPKKVRKE